VRYAEGRIAGRGPLAHTLTQIAHADRTTLVAAAHANAHGHAGRAALTRVVKQPAHPAQKTSLATVVPRSAGVGAMAMPASRRAAILSAANPCPH